MAGIQVYGPYHRASNTRRALAEACYWLKVGTAVAAIFAVWFVL